MLLSLALQSIRNRNKTKDLLKEGDQKHDSKGQFRKKLFKYTSVLEIDQKDRYGPGRKLRSLAIRSVTECVREHEKCRGNLLIRPLNLRVASRYPQNHHRSNWPPIFITFSSNSDVLHQAVSYPDSVTKAVNTSIKA